jgi:hypothetical protein
MTIFVFPFNSIHNQGRQKRDDDSRCNQTHVLVDQNKTQKDGQTRPFCIQTPHNNKEIPKTSSFLLMRCWTL